MQREMVAREGSESACEWMSASLDCEETGDFLEGLSGMPFITVSWHAGVHT